MLASGVGLRTGLNTAVIARRPRRSLLVAGDEGLQDRIVIELVRVQAHQVGWIDVVDADDLKRLSMWGGITGNSGGDVRLW